MIHYKSIIKEKLILNLLVVIMKNNLSIISLLQNLVARAPKQPIDKPELDPDMDHSKKIATTIRLEPSTRRFIEIQAEHLGISFQEFISMTLKSIMTATEEPQSTELELMVQRFFEVFDAHGISVADIPTLLPEGSLCKSDLLTKKDLLDRMDEKLIKHISDLFCVREKWIKGLDVKPTVTPLVTVYKSVEAIACRLAWLNHHYRSIKVYFVVDDKTDLNALSKARTEGDSVDAVNVGVIIEKNQTINGILIRTYEVLDMERWNYEKYRFDLKLLMLFCEKTNIFYSNGIKLPEDIMQKIFSGETFASSIISKLSGFSSYWHPDDLMRNVNENAERVELDDIKYFYNEELNGMDNYETAVREPYRVKNWDDFINGKIELLDRN